MLRPAAVLLALAAALGLAAPAPATAAERAPAARAVVPATADDDAALDTSQARVVLLGTGGIRWDDVQTLATPALWQLSRSAAIGTLAVRSVRSTTCPADGWLALSSGSRAADLPGAVPGECRTLRDARPDGTVRGWTDYVESADAASYDPALGLLGTQVADAGVLATGIGPGAAIALAGEDGVVRGTYRARPDNPAALAAAVEEALAQPGLVVVDLGGVREPGRATVARPDSAEATQTPEEDASGLAPDPGTGDPEGPDVITEPTRAQQLAPIDARLEAVLEAVADVGAPVTVLLASLADSGRPGLQVVAATGPATGGTGTYERALLTSGSTRQVGVTQATDLTPTVLAALGAQDGAPPLGGAMVVPVAAAPTATERVAALTSIAREASQVTRVSGAFMTRLVLAQAVLFAAAALVLTRGRRADRAPLRPALRVLEVAALALAAAPVASFLTGVVPWWTTGTPSSTFWLVLVAWVAVLTAVALAGPWRRHPFGPAAVVAGATVLALVLDMLTGSTLVVDSPMGAHRILAARFYGMSNQAFAMLVSAAVLVAVVVADLLVRRGRRGWATAAVAGIGVVVTVVDGTPGLGSDFGGPPAIVLAFALLTIVVSGRRVSWRTMLLVGLAAAVVVGGFMVADWLRPPGERTHLGRFLATALDGGLWDVLYRKVSVNLRVLTSWRYLLLAVGGVLLTALVLVGPRPRGDRTPHAARFLGAGSPLAGLQEAVPLLRPGVAAIGLALTAGFFINDSGIVVPATGIAVAVPCLVAAAARWRTSPDALAPVTGGASPAPAAVAGR